MSRSLLEAKSIATLPASAAGAVVLKTFETLGIADEMKAKIKAQPTTSDIPRVLAKGEAEMGRFLINVLDVPGAAVVGPFPAALQQEFVFRSTIFARTQNAIAAKAFVDFLKSPSAIAVIKAQGMTPPG
jgi:molybdate transport system substrate-binding protein